MANDRKYQFLFSKVPMLSYVQGQAVIGASGAVGTVSGNGITGVTKLAVGVYQVQLTEKYNALLANYCDFVGGVTGGAVTDGSFVATTLYQIVTLGTTNWSAVGLASGLTAAVGQNFVATGVGGSGGGTVKAIGASGIVATEVAGDPSKMLNPSTGGSYINISCYDKNDALASPATGSIFQFQFFLRNSSLVQ